MQSKTSSAHAHVARVGTGCVLTLARAVVLAPHAAYATTLEDAMHTLTESPVPMACAGVGFVVGAGLMGFISHNSHKATVADLEKRIRALEVMQPEEGDDVMLREEPKEVHPKQGDTNDLPEHTRQVVNSRKKLNKVTRSEDDERNSLPVIRRGDTGSQPPITSELLDQTHAMEVVKHLDGATRARMIERRIPSLAALIVPTVPVVAVAVDPEDDFTNPEKFDATAYVERIMQEEISHKEDEDARRFTRANLTVFEGAAASNETSRTPATERRTAYVPSWQAAGQDA